MEHSSRHTVIDDVRIFFPGIHWLFPQSHFCGLPKMIKTELNRSRHRRVDAHRMILPPPPSPIRWHAVIAMVQLTIPTRMRIPYGKSRFTIKHARSVIKLNLYILHFFVEPFVLIILHKYIVYFSYRSKIFAVKLWKTIKRFCLLINSLPLGGHSDRRL